MSAACIASVWSSYCKAEKLLNEEGQVLRAAKHFGQAAEAARALAPGPDNIAALSMQMYQAGALRTFVSAAADGVAAKDKDELFVLEYSCFAPQRDEFIALFSTAVTELERRRVAGTLLERKCTADEVAWYAADSQNLLWRQYELGRRLSNAEVAGLTKQVGYNVFLQAAVEITSVFLGSKGFS